MSGSTLALTITANDQTSKTITAIEANLARFGGNMQKCMAKFAGSTQSSIGQASETMQRYTTGLAKVSSGLRGVGRSASYTFAKVSELVPVLGIIGSAASVAGISRMTSQWAEWGLKVSNTARQISVGSQNLSNWQGAANLAGGSAEAMSSGMQTLGQTMYDALGERNTEAIVMFRTLGIAFDDGKRHARNSTQVMLEIADKVASIRDPFARAQVGVTLLGGAWQGLEPLLMLGSKRMQDLERVSKQYGYVTDEGIEKAKDMALAQRSVGAAVTGLGNRISERLAPILTPMLEHLARWIATSPTVTQGVELLGRGVAWLGNKLGNIDWDMLGKRAEEWGERLKSVLALLQRFGIVPDLSGVFGGGKSTTPAMPTNPTGSGFGANGPTVPPPKAGTEDNGLYNLGRNILTQPNPLNWTRSYHPPVQPRANAPNGIPRTGPTFGPQQVPGQVSRSAVDPTNEGATRGIRNNNPLNLGFVPGQVGLVADAPSDGRFGRYRTMEDGVAAAERQLLKYQVRDHLNSVRQMVSKWAPPGENDTESYVQHVAVNTG